MSPSPLGAAGALMTRASEIVNPLRRLLAGFPAGNIDVGERASRLFSGLC